MLALLEKILTGFDVESVEWESLHITYSPPVVERIWTRVGDCRLAFHRIHPCTADEALWHPHRWPSAVRVLKGVQEMKVGTWEKPLVTMILEAGDAYEMVDPDAWHQVMPISVSLSAMLMGPLYPRSPRGAATGMLLQPLSEEMFSRLIQDVKDTLSPCSRRSEH